jgi:hypothetical protein
MSGGNQGAKLNIFNIRHSVFCTHVAPSCDAPSDQGNYRVLMASFGAANFTARACRNVRRPVGRSLIPLPTLPPGGPPFGARWRRRAY